MAKYLSKLVISNLRNIKEDREIDFAKDKLVVFDGPNGYGKSTVFDAIELLFTGRLNHFYDKTYNKGLESLKTIANNSNKSTVITGTFIDGKSKYEITRTIKWEKSIRSEIQYLENDEQKLISEENLNTILNIDSNIFDIGMYISQSDSLNFLQKKYKERKNALTSIINTEEFEEKYKLLTDISRELTGKINVKKTEMREEIDQMKINHKKIINKLSNESIYSQDLIYKKLIKENNFSFDEKILDKSLDFATHEKILNDIGKYIESREDYINIIYNNKIIELLKTSENHFKACYYREWIHYFNDKHVKFQGLIDLQETRKTLQSNREIFKNVFFEEEYGDIYKIYGEKLVGIDIIEKRMSETDKKITQLMDQRKRLRGAYINKNILDKEMCPYCGRDNENLEEAFDALSDRLESLQDKDSAELKIAQSELDTFLSDTLLKEIDKLLRSQKQYIEKYKSVETLFNEDISNLMLRGKEFGIESFLYNKQDKTEFVDAFKIFKFRIENQYKSVSKDLTRIEIQNLNKIHTDIFNGKKITITTKEIEDKISYIKAQYDNDLFDEERIIGNKIIELEKTLTNFEEKSTKFISDLTELRNIRKKALNDYQTNFISEIKVALYIMSGRIIQTFPLGLGVTIESNETQLLFKVENKEEDIFNVLSTGQLNGLIIAVLLAVRKTFLKADSLDIILIDDPLQSIDDISAHSFVDLLGEEFSDSQVFLSTHETDKSSLLSYKYRQLGIPHRRVNMQDEFLKNILE
ncbi:AAA family ATPase [Listeria booriae]|uniref:AAA family ATPase n=1 Tax=Listeria booriae TaxID=1552123 RepID=UPI001623BEAA|nr:AAA family ATPase [Listeria booriae]MBC2196606.1 AAA family ATPase [Listeria booriae]